MQPAAFAAGELADEFLLIATLEVEAADVGACRRFVLADGEDVGAAGDLVEDGLAAVEAVAALVDVGEFHGFADIDFAGIGLFLACQHAEQRRFTSAVRTDDADDGAGRDTERQFVHQQAIAEGLADFLELDDLVAQPLADRMKISCVSLRD